MSPFYSDQPGQVQGKLMDLHQKLHPRVRNHNLDLHPHWQKSAVISQESAASYDTHNAVVLTYFRSREQAEKVERLMGRDEVGLTSTVTRYHHPVIELRSTPEHFAVELILSPSAWLDQQNLMGKLQFPAHRATLRGLLHDLDADYCFGFWSGTHLGDMHLTIAELLNGRILDEWMDTFAEGQDWLRIGKWYDSADPILDTPHILVEMFNAVKALHPIYNFILWSSNNDFRAPYEKLNRNLRRILS